MTDNSTAIVCNLTEPDARSRKAILRSNLKPYLIQSSYASGSSQLSFSKPAVTRKKLEQLIALERDCCPFFKFELSETNTHFQLHVTGPDGSEGMVRDFFSTHAEGECRCIESGQSSESGTTKKVVGFISLCAIACAVPPTLAALGLVSVATGAFIGRGIEVAVGALALIGLAYLLVQYAKTKRGTSS